MKPDGASDYLRTAKIDRARFPNVLQPFCQELPALPVIEQVHHDSFRLIVSSTNMKSWRLPNINELESLVDCTNYSPALPKDACFKKLRTGNWSSTTSTFEPDWAWALYLEKGAIGVGKKNGAHFYVWAVRSN